MCFFLVSLIPIDLFIGVSRCHDAYMPISISCYSLKQWCRSKLIAKWDLFVQAFFIGN